MTNFYERLYIGNQEWREQKALVDSLKARYEDCKYWYRRGIVKDIDELLEVEKQFHKEYLDAVWTLEDIENEIINRYQAKEIIERKVYAIDHIPDPMDDAYVMSLIDKNGFIKGFKF